MGLDQYLYRSRTKFYRVDPEARYSHLPEGECKTSDGIAIPPKNLGLMGSQEVTDMIGYLRKVNAVHGWIVRHLAEGVDDCQRIYLDRESVVMLVADLHDAIDNPKTNTGLPPTPGFFFGSTERDDWYLDDMKDALAIFTWLLEVMEADEEKAARDGLVAEYQYWYQASW